MVAARVYRRGPRCPHYGSNRMTKDGHSRSKQTYQRGDCHYRHTLEGNRHYYSAAVRERAVATYLEGSSMATIGGCWT